MEAKMNGKRKKNIKIKNLSPEERQRLVGAFAWLLEQDKKQNPEFYKNKKIKND